MPKKITITSPDGITYNSVTEACEAYGISVNTFYKRINRGMSPSEALSKKGTHSAVTAPDGTVYPSEKAMCLAEGINYGTYRLRRKKGQSIKDALNPAGYKRHGKITAPNGITYTDMKDMCRAYGIRYNTFRRRIEKGISVEDALLPGRVSIDGKNVPPSSIKSPDGKTYNTVSEMCRAYNITYNQYYNRVKHGWTQEEALGIQKKEPRTVIGPDGKAYRNVEEMCSCYGIKRNTYLMRLKKGLSQEEALTKKVKKMYGRAGKRVTGPDGKEYKSISAMCREYGISLNIYLDRVKNGMSESDALTKEVRGHAGKEPVTGPDGKTYSSVSVMCREYNIKPNVYYGRIRNGHTMEEALQKHLNKKDSITADFLGNVYKSENSMCKHYGISQATFRHRISSGMGLQAALTCKRRSRQQAASR